MSSIPASAAPATRPTASSVPFTATLASEWRKFITLRATWISAFLALVLAMGFTSLMAWVTGFSFDDWGEGDQASFDPITFGIVGMIFASIVFVVMGVQLVTSEYSSGMIRQTLTTTPRRGRILAAKLIVVVLSILVLSAIVGVASFQVAQVIYSAYDMPTAKLGDDDARKLLINMTLTSPTFPIIGVVMGFLLRSAAGAITFVLGLLFLPSMFGGLLPQRWKEDVVAYLPGSLADSITMHHLDSDNPIYADPGLAVWVLAAWMVAAIALAFFDLYRRDV